MSERKEIPTDKELKVPDIEISGRIYKVEIAAQMSISTGYCLFCAKSYDAQGHIFYKTEQDDDLEKVKQQIVAQTTKRNKQRMAEEAKLNAWQKAAGGVLVASVEERRTSKVTTYSN